jgi:phosphotriesterase-related protein
MGHVQTVRGPIASGDLGRVLPHEHLALLGPAGWLSSDSTDARVEVAIRALGKAPEGGVRSLVELTPIGLGRDPLVLREVAERTGVNIIVGAAFYLEPYSPAWAHEAALDEIEALFVREATVGIDGTDVKVGIYGEQASGLDEVTPFEEKCLRAVARAHRTTGLAINTHCTHGTMPFRQIEILREEGVDLSRTIIGHMDQAGFETVRSVLQTGVNVAYDTFGKELWDFVLAPPDRTAQPEGEFAKRGYLRRDTSRLQEVAELVRLGFADRVFLSQDMTGMEAYLNPETHGRHGYAYLGNVIVPALADLGVPAVAIEQMLVENPARLLTID